ncbi:hypothetical protein V1512DRAFT_263455 [Lipomyces arxii]|uniref:uncharacterized protein n=1 Tax=Lipomyces arxii TaxID=56418 RepID=UPI0034CFBAB4
MAPLPPSQQSLTRFFDRPPGSKPLPKRQSTISSLSRKSRSREDNKDATVDTDNVEIKSSASEIKDEFSSSPQEATADSPPSSPVSQSQTQKKRRRSRSVGSASEQELSPPAILSKRSNSHSPTRSKLNKVKQEQEDKKSKKVKLDQEEKAMTEFVASSDDAVDDEYNDSNSSLSEAEVKAEQTMINKILVKNPSWPAGSPVPYAALCATFEKIEATTKRLDIIAYCSAFYQEVLALTPSSLLSVIYLFINRLCPDYEGIELGLGESVLMKAIGECTGRSQAQIKADYKRTGDLGTVARDSRMNQPTMFKPKALTVEGVFKTLKEIAMTTGTQSQARKIAMINKMLSACQGNEAKYLVRSLEGKLRIHLAEKTVLTSLAQAVATWEFRKTGKQVSPADTAKAEEILRTVYSEMPTYDKIIPAILSGGIMNLHDTCTLTPGVPLKPMLAKPTKSITEVLDRFVDSKFTCEYKYDGERAQIHLLESGKSYVYSRNSEDMSAKYPDIMSSIPRFVKATTTSFVLDCEAVAWDRETNKILPFQVLSTRKRKDVQEDNIKVRVCVFAFDILYLNGESLVKKPLQKRRELLRGAFNTIEGEFAYAISMDASSVDEIQEFLDESIKDSCEGLMVKMLEGNESGYEPSKRSRNWLKLKKDYLTGVGDSLDLVVIGAYYGRGKRTNWYGAYLLACYNPETQEYETICKIGTGFTEEVLDDLYQKLSKTVIDQPRSYYAYTQSNNTAPDVWFEPTMVWEVLAADLSLSPIYRAAMTEVGRNKGVSLRFPRFIRIRDDKSPEDATTSEQVCEFYNSQASTGSAGGNDLGEDDY